MLDECGVPIDGSCAPGFERVRDAFEANFTDRDDIGAAVAVWVEGDLDVNLWGGFADAAGLRPWREDTLASIYSGSKGLTSTCVHLLADRGELDLHAPVAKYWPEFGQAGKQDITVAMVLGHRSGVIGPRTRLHWADAVDWDAVCTHIAAAEPWWEPGTAQSRTTSWDRTSSSCGARSNSPHQRPCVGARHSDVLQRAGPGEAAVA